MIVGGPSVLLHLSESEKQKKKSGKTKTDLYAIHHEVLYLLEFEHHHRPGTLTKWCLFTRRNGREGGGPESPAARLSLGPHSYRGDQRL